LSVLTGTDAERERAAADRTRRVVLASLGVLKDQQAGRRRNRSVALAVTLLVLVVIGPLVWWVVDMTLEEEMVNGIVSHIAIWSFVLSTALLSALLAGWMRRNS